MDDSTNKGDGELGILARRKIEAAIIAPIYDEMRQAIGEERRATSCAAPFAARRSTPAPKWPRAQTAERISKASRRSCLCGRRTTR
jgi:hypothetical protein